MIFENTLQVPSNTCCDGRSAPRIKRCEIRENSYNNGGWHDFGFLLGLGMFGGGARQSYSSSRRNSYE